MATRVLQQEEIDRYVPAIKAKLEGREPPVSDEQIQSVLNEYLEVAEDAPEDYQNKSKEEIVNEIVEKITMAGGRRRSKQSKKRFTTRRRRSSKRKSRKMNKRRR